MREVNDVATVTREDLERAAWAASGWSQDQAVVDELLATVDAYLAGAEPPVPAEPVVVTVTVPAEAVPLDEASEPVAAATVEPVPDGEKRCAKCGVTRPVSEFYRDKHSTTGFKARCKDCLNEDRKDARRRAAERGGA